MPSATLEDRIAALEKQVASMLAGQKATKDWRNAIGLFSGNELMKEIDAAGRAIREEERRKPRRRATGRKRKAS